MQPVQPQAPPAPLKRLPLALLAFSLLVAIPSKALADPGQRATVNVAHRAARSPTAPIIGAYYYPWYGPSPTESDDDHQWRHVFRCRLQPPQKPLLACYSSSDSAVIQQHLQQSRRAGLSFWAVSWWGPDSPTDQTFRRDVLAHPDAKDFRFAVLYESTGRLGSFDAPDYSRWTSDLAYLAEHYFTQPNYLKINDRPVLFVYLTRVYFRQRGAAALEEGRRRFGSVYLVGDDVFGPDYQPAWARPFGAVTVYDVYGQSMAIHGATSKAVAALAKNYSAARHAANSAAAAFIPTVAPGYNDSAVRNGHDGVPRYLVDDPNSREGDLFRAAIQQAALPNLDDRAGRLMMVTSFNEWYEDTQIEPTSGAAPPTTADDSPSGRAMTLGFRYEDYGNLYLDILRETAFAP